MVLPPKKVPDLRVSAPAPCAYAAISALTAIGLEYRHVYQRSGALVWSLHTGNLEWYEGMEVVR